MSSYRTLFEIGKSLVAETDIGKLLPLAMDKVIEQTHAERGMIMVYGKNGELLSETARHLNKQDLDKPEFEVSKTIIESVRQSGTYVVIKNALDDSRFSASASIGRLRLLSVACAPLRTDDETFGFIYIDNRELTGVFDENTGKLLNEFADLIAVAIKNALERRRLETETSQQNLKLIHEMQRRRELEERLAKSEGYEEIKGLKSLAMLNVCNQVDKVADTNSPVLIIGETGTGKELVARVLHRKSKRSEQPFVALNCAALPGEDLLISELYGHAKSAFTGADKDRLGYFETADGSTIFLDEIAKSSLKFQAKLLRVLESGEFSRLGETKVRTSDVRIISAAGHNLPELMNKGEFFPDLYYRLESFVIRVPALRERREDILEIAEYFLRHFAETHGRRASVFSDEASELLLGYHWPGNVRELRNAINRAVILADGEIIQAEDLSSELQIVSSRPVSKPSGENFNQAKQGLIEKFEREFIAARLRESNGNVSEAARRAGMHKKNFIQKMQQYGMRREEFVNGQRA